jgi:hypothetical protein
MTMDDPEDIKLSGAVRRELTTERIFGMVAAFALLVVAAIMVWSALRSVGFGVCCDTMHAYMIGFCMRLISGAVLFVLSVIMAMHCSEGNATRRLVLKLSQRIERLEAKQKERESEPRTGG